MYRFLIWIHRFREGYVLLSCYFKCTGRYLDPTNALHEHVDGETAEVPSFGKKFPDSDVLVWDFSFSQYSLVKKFRNTDNGHKPGRLKRWRLGELALIWCHPDAEWNCSDTPKSAVHKKANSAGFCFIRIKINLPM